MNTQLSTLTTSTKNPGYLLVELMIALVAIALCSVMAAYLQVHITQLHKQAEQYLKAVNIANTIFEETMFGQTLFGKASIKNNGLYDDTYTIETTQSKVDKNIPYTQIAVTISWKTLRGADKKITIHGGKVDHESV